MCADEGTRKKVDPLMVRQLSVKFSGATSVPVSQLPAGSVPRSPEIVAKLRLTRPVLSRPPPPRA